jgi:hypothetical protein
VLTAAEIRTRPRRRRAPYSDKQHYQEYILQRIEGYKNSIGRDELLRLGDEAASELQAAAEGQFVLTEVLMLESVDRLIMRRLSLRSYRKWRQQFIKLRAAQRTPAHWGLEPHCPIAWLLPRLEPEDTALVVGQGGECAAYLLAAHDVAVNFVASDLCCVEQVESRMAGEALATLFEGYVAQLSPALPSFLDALQELDLVVVDPAVLVTLGDEAERRELLLDLQRRSRPGGVHILLSSCAELSPHELVPHYEGWAVEEDTRRRRRSGGGRPPDGVVLCRPPCPADTT